MKKDVSVILPAYNAGPYIAEAIQSILNQTYTNFELIIINDCSTDNTEEIILSFSDPRIVYHKNIQNSGLVYNLNLGLSLASGKYIVRMDADDISMPTRIQEQVDFMDVNPEIGISGTGFNSFGNVNTTTYYEFTDSDIKLQMLYHCRFCHPTVIIRKQVLDHNNLTYSADYPHAEDYELWARMSFITKFANIQKILLKYRVHSSNVTFTYAGAQRKNSDRVIEYFFNKIGVDIDIAIIPLWMRFCYADFTLSITEIKQIENLSLSLINANNYSNYVGKTAMEVFLSEKWFNLCYNNAKTRDVKALFINSKISALLPFKRRLKFLLKSLI